MKTKKLTRSQERSREGGDDGKSGGGELHLLVGTKEASGSDDGKQINERQSRWWSGQPVSTSFVTLRW